MATNPGAARRPSASPPTSLGTQAAVDDDQRGSPGEHNLVFKLKLSWPFSIPSTPEAAARRITQNLSNHALYYLQFVWVVLFITLIPKRKVSVIYLVIMKEITLMYLMLIRAFPKSLFLHKAIDKRAVLFVVSLITANMMILTDAGIHFFASVGGTVPVVLMHAVLWRCENHAVFKEGSGGDEEELVELVGNKDGDGNVIVQSMDAV